LGLACSEEGWTQFEKHFHSNPALFNCLQDFAMHQPPTVLWGGHARWKSLYIHLVVRFCGNPDTVLDCEGTHARWQWLMNTKRSIKFKLINSMLKLSSEVLSVGRFPPNDVLRPHIRDIRAETLRQAEAIGSDPAIAAGCRHDMMYRSRFNLSANELELLKRELQQTIRVAQSFEASRDVYHRALLEPCKVYAFMDLQETPRCFYVAESKAFAGKDAPASGEAAGRFVSVAWLEADEPLHEGVHVWPVNRWSSTLQLQTYTIAELVRAAGLYEPIVDGETPRDQELKYDRKFLDLGLVVFTEATRTVGDSCGDSFWCFELKGSQDVESKFFEVTEGGHLNKLQLARLLIVSGKANRDDWKRLASLSKAALAAKFVPACKEQSKTAEKRQMRGASAHSTHATFMVPP
jgi:hypothetical protein